MEKCLRLPEITEVIFSQCENEELRGMMFIPGLSGGSIEELRKRRKISAKFKLGSLEEINGEICKKTENVMIKIGNEWSALLANIQLTAVAALPLEIIVENGYIFTPAMVKTLRAFRLNVKSFTSSIESLTSLSGPLDFNQLDKLKITGGMFEASRFQFLRLIGDCQPVEIEITEDFLQEVEIGTQLGRLRKLKIKDAYRIVYNNSRVWRNLFSAKSTLEELEVNESISHWIVNINDVRFLNLKELSMMADNLGSFEQMPYVFPNLQTLELRAPNHIDRPRGNHWDPLPVIKTLRFKMEATDLNLVSCPTVGDLFANVESVEFTGSGYSGASIYQFFRHNHWPRRVKITGNFCCPNDFTPFNFLQEMTEVQELDFSPSFNHSKIDWSSIRGALCSLPNLRKLSLKQVKNVDLLDLNRFPDLRLTNCSVINAEQQLVYPNFVACKLK